jgi:AraC family transcriptional regulator
MRVIRHRNPAGEFGFEARGLYLSLTLRPSARLEQVTTDGLWSGRTQAGDVKVMLPGEPRTFRHARPCEFAHLTIERDLLNGASLRPHAALRDLPLRRLIEALAAEAELGPPSSLFEDAAARAIVARLQTLDGHARPGAPSGLGSAKLGRVLELIEDRLAENLSVRDLAREVDSSPSHFAAQFAMAVGEPPHRYQIRRRVERAWELLRAGATAAEAAVAVGFYDQSHLSRHMRRVLGTSPAGALKSRITP